MTRIRWKFSICYTADKQSDKKGRHLLIHPCNFLEFQAELDHLSHLTTPLQHGRSANSAYSPRLLLFSSRPCIASIIVQEQLVPTEVGLRSGLSVFREPPGGPEGSPKRAVEIPILASIKWILSGPTVSSRTSLHRLGALRLAQMMVSSRPDHLVYPPVLQPTWCLVGVWWLLRNNLTTSGSSAL